MNFIDCVLSFSQYERCWLLERKKNESNMARSNDKSDSHRTCSQAIEVDPEMKGVFFLLVLDSLLVCESKFEVTSSMTNCKTIILFQAHSKSWLPYGGDFCMRN